MKLKNEMERRAYAQKPENWETVSEVEAIVGHRSLKVERLKGTPIVRILGWVCLPWFGGSWHELGTYELVGETGAVRTIESLSMTKIAKRLKDLGI